MVSGILKEKCIMNIFLTLLIAILAAIASFLPSTGTTGSVYDNSTRFSGFNRLRPKGRLIVALIVSVLGLTALQNWLNDREQTSKYKAQKIAFDSSLSEMKSLSDANNRQTIISITKTQNETLGKYGFMLDTTSKRLVKVVRDSSKTKVFLAMIQL
jgi:hypothetical protein